MSLSHLLLIAIVALVLFGPNKLPELGRAIGRTMREFKKGAEGLMDDIQESAPREERKDVTPRPAPDPVSGLVLPPPAPPAPASGQQAESVPQAAPTGSTQAASPGPAQASASPQHDVQSGQAPGAGADRPEKPAADTRRLPD